MKDIIYLDYAAATPMDESVLAAMMPYYIDKFHNPSATYLAAREVHQDLKQAHETVANILGVRASEIIFTSGGSEANNLAVNGVMSQFPGANIVTGITEHDSVLVPAASYDHRVAPVNQKGEIDLEALNNLIDNDTVMVSIMYANNEIGTISSLKDIASLIEAKRQLRRKNNNSKPLIFHTDACQSAAYLGLHVSRLGVDMMTLNGGKIYGPKQSGVLMVKTGIKLKPQILGGGQESGMRSGTENVANDIGFARALELVQGRRDDEVDRLKQLQKQFIDGLQLKLPEISINGSLNKRLPNNVHATFPGIDNERLMMELDEHGIICAVGSACSASNDEPSHVLKAIGLNDSDAQSSLRFTMGINTKSDDIERVISTLTKLINN